MTIYKCGDCGKIQGEHARRNKTELCRQCWLARNPRANALNYRGGCTAGGYKLVMIDGKYVPEHRLVWEAAHGKLPDGWVVHHINGEKLDNRLENLIALPRKKHNANMGYIMAAAKIVNGRECNH